MTGRRCHSVTGGHRRTFLWKESYRGSGGKADLRRKYWPFNLRIRIADFGIFFQSAICIQQSAFPIPPHLRRNQRLIIPSGLALPPDHGNASHLPSYRAAWRMHCSRTLTPASQSSHRVFSTSTWLRPPMLGTNIIAVGPTRLT